jgi:hypothetical protein
LLIAAKRTTISGTRLEFVDALALEQELFTELVATSEALKALIGST